MVISVKVYAEVHNIMDFGNNYATIGHGKSLGY